MACTQPPDLDFDDVEVNPEVSRLVEADALAALEYLCTHADDWPDGREVSECLARRRRRVAASPRGATRRAG